jgi:uncharacterized protein (DUF2062 family)
MLLLLLVGVVAAALCRRLNSPLALLAVLTATQIAGHMLLSATADPMPHAHGSQAVMLVTHLIAIPVCALLIAGGTSLYGVITSVLAVVRRLLGGTVAELGSSNLPPSPHLRPLVGVFAPGGTGVRGPPAK